MEKEIDKLKISEIILFIIIFIGVISLIVTVTIVKKNKSNSKEESYIPSLDYCLLDLGSTSCKPCSELREELKVLNDKYGDIVEIKFYDIINTTDGASYATYYEVTLMPTLLFLDNSGNELYRIVGYETNEVIENKMIELGWIV